MNKKEEKQIKEIIDKFRLIVSTHGGDVKLLSIKDNTVSLDLLGACAGCSLADLSYNTFLGGLIREKFPQVEIKFNKKIKKIKKIK